MAREPQSVTKQPEGELTVRTIAMPADTNANGDIFGGWVMAQMDLAGGMAGVERAQGRVATVAVDAMTFLSPVRVGDILCVYTRITAIGRTSMKIQIEAWARRFRRQVREKVTEATFTFVAIDDEGATEAGATCRRLISKSKRAAKGPELGYPALASHDNQKGELRFSPEANARAKRAATAHDRVAAAKAPDIAAPQQAAQ
ncbi:acyl-CoA thioesterase [Micromonospora sp. STR1s_5]|nr:acyl-CoA thioesterase [Micromonospora sp. STR1s_5]